jgi:hypothetical protein
MIIFAKKFRHMKKILFLTTLVFFVSAAYTQVSLSYKNNALVAGDSIISREIQYVSPGEAGPNQIWDFSKIQFTAKNLVCDVYSAAYQEYKDAGAYNVISNEDGYTYFNYIDQNVFEVMGYKTEKVSLVYSNPSVKIKYPFSYGDQFTDHFTGNAFANAVSEITFDGENTVTADAYGTLVLPDFNIKNTLRVKTEKNAIEVRPCSMIEAHIVQYNWYAPGFRYPVMSLLTKEYKYNGEEPADITHTAYISLQQTNGNVVANVEQSQNSMDNSDFTVISYPNPFSEKITFSYFLRKQMPVTVGLYDISGKLLLGQNTSQLQSDGLHTDSFDAAANGLTPGVYYIRFTFDKKTVVNKVVKI